MRRYLRTMRLISVLLGISFMGLDVGGVRLGGRWVTIDVDTGCRVYRLFLTGSGKGIGTECE